MSRYRIVVADKVAPEGVAYLEGQDDIDVDFAPGLPRTELEERLAGAHGLIVRSAVTVDTDLMDAAPGLRVVGRAGIGVDNIDLSAATQRGIIVLNTPDANATTTAELTVAHILSLSRHLPQANASLRSGAWERSRYVGVEVRGKTAGLIGFGSIGRLVAHRLKGLGMEVLAFDPFVTADVLAERGVEATDLDDLLARSDYVTLHCPVTPKTRGLLSRERLMAMKPGARLINCARGGLVDEGALAEALTDGPLAGAALDVFESEPPGEHPLFQLPNVVATPHLGASTVEAQVAVGVEIAKAVATYLRTGEALSSVNLPPLSSEQARRLAPYQQLARRLAALAAIMTDGPVQKLTVARHGRAADLDGQALARSAVAGLYGDRLSYPVNDINALHVAEDQGVAVVETRSEERSDFATLLVVTAQTATGQVEVEGTLYDERHPRLVGVNGHALEALLEGHLLLTRHRDEPGVIGSMGHILGDENVNISRMQVGAANGSAWAILTVSEPLTTNVLQRVRDLKAIAWAEQLSFEPASGA